MSPFVSVDHTADIAYYVSGRTMEELFTDAAKAWLDSTVVIERIDSPQLVELNFSENTYESLLVAFLSELNYLLSVKKFLCFESAKLSIGENEEKIITVVMKGFRIDETNCILKEDIKAITYHQLDIVKNESGYSTTLIFDI